MSLVRKRCISLVVILSLLFFAEPRRAKADSLASAAVAVIAVVAVVGAGIGIGIYLLVRKAPSVTGCLSSPGTGLQLETESHDTYLLTGDIDGLHAGQKVQLFGKKRKENGHRSFIVEKAPKFQGSCAVAAATP